MTWTPKTLGECLSVEQQMARSAKEPKPDHAAAIAELEALLARLQANRGGTLTGGVALAIEVLQGNKHGW